MSVIIPVYNAEKHLRRCLDSVVGQTLEEIEIICVDDGSTDDSANVLVNYAAEDKRIHILKQINAGAGAARNLGLENAAGEYIAFIDADDWAETDFCEQLYKCAKCSDADVAICRAQRFDDVTGEPLPSEWMLKDELLPGNVFFAADVSKRMFQFTYGQVWDKLFRRSFINERNIRFPELRAAEDTPFAYISLLSAGKIAVQPSVLLHYRVNQADTTSGSFAKYPDAPFKAFGMIYAFLKTSGEYEKYEQSFLNWAMEYLVWQVCNMPNNDIRRRYYDEVKAKWIPELGLDRLAHKYVYDSTAREKYLLMRYTPFPVFSFLLDAYKKAVVLKRD